MLNEIEKAYKKSDVYLEVLSYLEIFFAVSISVSYTHLDVYKRQK